MPDTEPKSRPYLTLAMAVALAWTLSAALSLTWNLRTQSMSITRAARTAARTAYEKDIDYRSWSARHGGVYVPVSRYAAPNPYLDGIEGRDIETVDGRRLTLLNPAYMNRQVHDLERTRRGVRGHLTSLNPIRPANAPDEWERDALEAMEAGADEVSAVVKLDGSDYMRLIRPVITEEGCLKCHARQGYEVGQIRGALSVSVPMEPFRAGASSSVRSLWFWHIFTWIMGICGIAYTASRLASRDREQEMSRRLIKNSLEEKEFLLKEIHHRVKNNLQVISGMLELQASLVTDPSARAVLQEGRSRVMSMALIHQKLYQSQDMARVNMKSYLQSLVDDLVTAFGLERTTAVVNVEVEPVRLNLDTAVPLGMIVSELVTNAFKYAFPPDAANGSVSVFFSEFSDGRYRLVVSDDGVGLPPDFDLQESPTLGLRLVHSLVGQLNGEIQWAGAPGTEWTIICSPYHGADGVLELSPT